MATLAIDSGVIARLDEVWRRALPYLGSDARRELEAIISPQSLAVIAGVIAGVVVAWVVSHAFGVGEIVDFLIGLVGFISLGTAVFSGLDHLFGFALATYRGRTPGELDHAARELAEAIAILGVTAVLALLFRGRPRTYRGSRIGLGPEPPRNPGIRYKPTTRTVHGMGAGEGFTSSWGDVEYSADGSATDQALVRVHEKIHQLLTPRLYALRRFRIEQRMASYVRSSFSRWLEEALAETVARVRVQGVRQLPTGLRFPVRNGYVSLFRGGAPHPDLAGLGGSGLLTEAGGLIGTVSAGSVTWNIYFRRTR